MKPFDSAARSGSGRPTVVLLHSSGSSARQWSALVERMRAFAHVHALDVHGHGARAPLNGAHPLRLADDAALVAPFLDAAPARSVHLVGHSYGAAVVLKAAARRPDAVASVTVYEPVLFRWLADDGPEAPATREVVRIAETLRKYLSRGDAWRAAGVFVNYWTGPGTWESMPSARRDTLAARMRSVLAHFDALFREPLAASDLRCIEDRLLVLTGAQTVASAERLAALLRAALPRARHERLQGMGHMGPVTHPDAINARILAFVVASERAQRSMELRQAA